MLGSISLGSSPARGIASVLAFAPISAPPSPGWTQRRCSIPVRSMIHSFDVSIFEASSSLVTTRGGTYMPMPRIRLRCIMCVALPRQLDGDRAIFGGMNVLLVRHGETPWNREGRYQGRTDIALSETGLAQARSLGVRLAQIPIAIAISSPLSLARNTARTILASRPTTAASADGRELGTTPLELDAGLLEI